jgi:hypothetical protein
VFNFLRDNNTPATNTRRGDVRKIMSAQNGPHDDSSLSRPRWINNAFPYPIPSTTTTQLLRSSLYVPTRTRAEQIANLITVLDAALAIAEVVDNTENDSTSFASASASAASSSHVHVNRRGHKMAS